MAWMVYNMALSLSLCTCIIVHNFEDDAMKVTWADVVGFEGLYEVSTMGEVRRSTRCPDNWRSRINTWPGRLCKQMQNKDGYKIVGLWMGGKVYKRKVHSLVAKAFLGVHKGMEVNHIDGKKSNNALANLEYVTHADNMKHAKNKGLYCPYEVSVKGELHWKAKLKKDDILSIRSSGSTQKELAQKYGVSEMTIRRIQQRKSWRHIE